MVGEGRGKEFVRLNDGSLNAKRLVRDDNENLEEGDFGVPSSFAVCTL